MIPVMISTWKNILRCLARHSSVESGCFGQTLAGKNIFWRKRSLTRLKGTMQTCPDHPDLFFSLFFPKKMQVTSRWKRKWKANKKNKVSWVSWIVRKWMMARSEDSMAEQKNHGKVWSISPMNPWFHLFIDMSRVSSWGDIIYLPIHDPYKQE